MSCSSHCCGAEKIFDDKGVKKALKRYRKKGPEKFHKLMLEALKNEDIKGATLLDIGGGIGILQHELLIDYLSKTTDVDASQAYIEGAKQIMNEKGLDGKMTFIYGDYNEHYQEITNHDIVTLSRVVCCYPNVDELINNSITKANNYYGLVYPTDNFIAKLIIGVMNFTLYVRRNPFRTFVHSVNHMNELIENQGFERVFLGNAMHWRIALYKKVD